MTLDEAIIHAEEVEKAQTENAEFFDLGEESSELYKEQHDKCIACAEEHHQLAAWLKELRMYRQVVPDLGEAFRAGHGDADPMPEKYSELVKVVDNVRAEVKKAKEEIYDAPQDVYEPDYWMREGMDFVLDLLDKRLRGKG